MRTYARLVADQLEHGGAPYSDEQARALLENVLLSGEGVLAELEFGGRVVRAELGEPGSDASFPGDDFAFGAGGDDTYYLSIRIARDEQEGVLRIGFDERPTKAHIHRTRVRMLLSLAGFFVVSMVLAMLLGRRMARPLVELQRASRQVASGEMSTTLDAKSGIAEVRDLTHDLEVMRSRLVSVSGRLRAEMAERDAAEKQRRRLEDRLAERRRLETVGTLAGGIAHEFNNILVPIQLYTELAIEDLEAGSPIREDLLRVQEAARRAKRIVRDVLVFTRGPEGGAQRAVNVAEIAAEVVRLYERMAPAGVRVRQEIRDDCPWVNGDAGMINQVIFNLCSNACQAMADGDGLLTVAVGPAHAGQVALTDLGPGDYVDVRVSDTGHGIDEKTRPHIFEPFFTTRTVGHGTGLGLFVVHAMVTTMGGGVVVESEPGVGTSFHVLLRVAGHEADQDS
jgi:signal transduction histidine kinase